MELIFLLAYILIIGIPLAIIVLGYKWLSRKGYKKVAQLFLIVTAGYLIYSFYTAFYPNESFYRDEFERNTNLRLPKDAEFISKDATFPDQHGKYISYALVHIDTASYDKLLNEVTFNPVFLKDPQDLLIKSLQYKTTNGIADEEIEKIAKRKKMVIVFLKDKKRILLERQLY